MVAIIIIGSQWGDEGKGKFIDFLSETSDLVVRFHGGNNAGHTVINSFGKFPMHLIPSGIFSPKITACITNGVVLDLEVLVSEIEMLEKNGVSLKNLYISPRCHIILPYHKILDRLYEEAKGKAKTGTTGRGIGPVYADKVSYNGIRLSDAVDKKIFSEKLFVQLTIKNKIIKALGEKPLVQAEIENLILPLVKKLLPYIREPYVVIQRGIKRNKNFLFEGAHGVFLDNDWGTYPFVTGSTVLAGGVNSGAGFPFSKLTEVIGVVKAYTTRVGAGPFPTELLNETGEKLRAEGEEFGTTTGRARRCGWFDAELVRFAREINGYTSIAVTKLDVLDNMKEINIGIGYSKNGQRVSYFDGDDRFLESVKPIYKTLAGWQTSIKGITKFEKLPKLAQKYVLEIEKQTGAFVKYISTGPSRYETITR